MRLAVLTTGRQDWGILRSTCLRLQGDARFELLLLVGGMHLSDRFGTTERHIKEDGFNPARRLVWVGEDNTATRQAGLALAAVGDALEVDRPDALVLVGDRFETSAAAVAATIVGVPIAHLHGGEETLGAFDDSLRHAISKLSHLHLVSHPDHRRRLQSLGENPDSIHVVGAPGLDNLHRADLPGRPGLERELGVRLEPPVVLVTLHPTTRGDGAERELEAVTAAMERVAATYIVTLSNADPGNESIRQALRGAAIARGGIVVEALGERRYWGLLRSADAMLGNSSSALVEAPAVPLPAVNVGARQEGRLRGLNVIDVPQPNPDRVTAALAHALDPATRNRLTSGSSPYGDGRSAERIVEVLAAWAPPKPTRKPPVRLAGLTE